jgi:hypothetical protein
MGKITGCVVFSAETKKNVEKDYMGRQITEWIKANPFAALEEKYFVQSDNFISVTIFYSGQAGEVNPLDKL